MAFAQYVEWEVRNGGSDANGGGFDPVSGTPGTDYSQQDAAQVTYTDLVIDGATNTDCTSAGNPFTAAHVGNIVNVTSGSGFTVQRVQVMSVTAGVARMDKSLGTLSSTGGNGVLGGGFASIGRAGSVHVAGNTIWIKYHASAYVVSSTSQNVSNGRFSGATASSSAPISILGYGTTRGDSPAGDNRPKIEWGVNGANNWIILLAGTTHYVRNLIIDGKRGTYTGTRGIATCAGVYENIKATGFVAYAMYPYQANSKYVACEITDTPASALEVLAVGGLVLDRCYIHDNPTASPCTISTGTTTLIDTIFESNSGGSAVTISGAASVAVIGCAFYGNTGAGINCTAAPIALVISNTIFEANTTYGVATSASYPGIAMRNCAFYNNTSGTYQNMTAKQLLGEIIPTASVFVDAANGDFRLNMKAGGGALLRGAAYPQTFPGLTWANRRDIGAHQHSGSSRGING